MPITRRELTTQFGRLVANGNAALFLGAGMSVGRGLPTWEDLLRPLRHMTGIPKMTDLPLLAEYLTRDPKVGRQALETHIWAETVGKGLKPGRGHEFIGRIPVQQVWTTNYDTLIEQADATTPVVATESEIQNVGWSKRTIIKMHGHPQPGTTPMWRDPPVISRSDFENYSDRKPRTWSMLQATYMSQSILFLGFSFADPNIDLLLQLARRTGTSQLDRHITVLRRPGLGDSKKLRLHSLLVADLEANGISVHEIDEYGELDDILAALARRTTSPRIFISGSHHHEDGVLDIINQMAVDIADHRTWQLASLGGPSAWSLSKRVAHVRKIRGTYEAEAIKLHFKGSTSSAPKLDSRVGTAVYTDLDRPHLAREVIDGCRVVLVLSGQDRTLEEVSWARDLGVPVVPIAATGGSASVLWSATTAADTLIAGEQVCVHSWNELEDAFSARHGGVALLRQALDD